MMGIDPDLMRLLIAKLASIKDSAYYWPPEGMNYWWRALHFEFHCAIFGTDDQSKWDRDSAPVWAHRAGHILAGEDNA